MTEKPKPPLSVVGADPPLVKAEPFKWTDPQAIPPRDWLHDRHTIRGFPSATVSPGGVGKTQLVITETLSQVTGRNLLGCSSMYYRPLRVWLWNLEDPKEEIERRIQATCLHYGITKEDIGDRLFLNSGRDSPLIIAETTRFGTVITAPVVEALVAELVRNRIDLLTIDPFVSCHKVSENDNSAIDMVAKEWGSVAGLAKCGAHIIHQTRKQNGDAEITTDSSRGAKALTDACRSVRVLNRMTEEEGKRAGVDNHRLYFRTGNDKANMAPPSDKARWFRLQGVDLGNATKEQPSDNVGVVVPWEWPDAFAGVTVEHVQIAQRKIAAGKWRDNVQSKNEPWAGVAVAEAIGADLSDPADKDKVKRILATWLNSGALKTVESEPDDKGKTRKYVEVGEWQ